MIDPAQAVKIVITAKPVDFRKGHDGLVVLVWPPIAEAWVAEQTGGKI